MALRTNGRRARLRSGVGSLVSLRRLRKRCIPRDVAFRAGELEVPRVHLGLGGNVIPLQQRLALAAAELFPCAVVEPREDLYQREGSQAQKLPDLVMVSPAQRISIVGGDPGRDDQKQHKTAQTVNMRRFPDFRHRRGATDRPAGQASMEREAGPPRQGQNGARERFFRCGGSRTPAALTSGSDAAW